MSNTSGEIIDAFGTLLQLTLDGSRQKAVPNGALDLVAAAVIWIHDKIIHTETTIYTQIIKNQTTNILVNRYH